MGVTKGAAVAVAMPPEGLRFLADLQRHNDKAWFEQNRSVYVDAVKEPWLDVVDAVSERLSEFAPEYVRPAAQAVMRIHRDVRFSKDKTPYNPRVAAAWARSGLDKFGAASFYLAVTPSGVEVGAGSYAPSTAQLAAIRDHLLLHHGDARRALDRASAIADTSDGQELQRPPRGFPEDHPALDLALRRRWVALAGLPREVAARPDFVDTVVDRFREFAPLVEWLNVPLAEVAPPARR